MMLNETSRNKTINKTQTSFINNMTKIIINSTNKSKPVLKKETETMNDCFYWMIFIITSLFSFPAYSFKMGGSPISNSIMNKFGDSVHEDMTRESIEFARLQADKLKCKIKTNDLDDFIKADANAKLSHEMCCHEKASSRLCRSLGKNQTKPFKDENNFLSTGTRWNDDICHMTQDKNANKSWAARWMTGAKVEKFNNLNYASHYHELQILHSMAPTSRKNRFDNLDAKSTIRRINMWAEFSFRVAEGSIPTNIELREVRKMFKKETQVDFDLAFGAWKYFQVDQLFSGVKNASSAHIRQIALGALLHTIQDSFSSSHVQREKDPMDGFYPLVGFKGNIVRFHTYRLQETSKHANADMRPTDLKIANIGDLHPVGLGAQLISCAVAGQSEHDSRWTDAKEVVDKTFKLANPIVNLRANAGSRFRRDNYSDSDGQ